MNIGITGSSGFLGINLIKELKKQEITFTLFDREKFNIFDIKSLKDFVQGKDIIIHLAGVNRDGSLIDVIRTNVWGTKCLMEAIAQYSPQTKLIFASSSMVYINDDFFGVSKKIAEEIIEDYAKQYSIKATILRLTNIYGIGCKPYRNSVIATFIYKESKGESISISGDGEQVRDFLYIDDATQAFINSLSYTPKLIEYFDICTSQFTSINTLVSILKKLSSKEIKVEYNNSTTKNHPVAGKKYEKAKELLFWTPRVSLEEGLRIMMNQM